MSTYTIKGELEVDPIRGVIYFHSTEPVSGDSITKLRICRLGKLYDLREKALDVTHMHGHNHFHFTRSNEGVK